MSITNATYKGMLTSRFFEKNGPLSKLVNIHNKYIGLYSPGKKTESDINQAVREDSQSSLFYLDEDIKNIIERCLVIEKQYEGIIREYEKLHRLETLKDNYWENMDSLFVDMTRPLSLGATTGGLMVGTILLACGGFATLGAVMAFPIIFTGIGIILFAAGFIKGALDQKHAKDEYFKIFPKNSDPQDTPTSFFNRKKEVIEKEIVSIQVPEQFSNRST